MSKQGTTHASSEKRTADIIQAALECFTDPGFTETSIADICIKANASIGSVYHHFKSKEQLAAAVYLKGIEVYQSGMINAIYNETEAGKGVITVVKYHLKWIQYNSDWARFLFLKKDISFSVENEKALLALNKKFIQQIQDWFGVHMDAGIIHTMSWDMLISLLLGPCLEFTGFYLSKKSVTKIDNAIRELSAAALRSLSIDR